MPPQLLSQKAHGADRNLATARLYLQLSLPEQSTAIKEAFRYPCAAICWLYP